MYIPWQLEWDIARGQVEAVKRATLNAPYLTAHVRRPGRKLARIYRLLYDRLAPLAARTIRSEMHGARRARTAPTPIDRELTVLFERWSPHDSPGPAARNRSAG